MTSTGEGDRILATRSELDDRLAVLLGGRAAEELVLGQPSTGSNDALARATDLARRMVVECGMTDRLGPLAFAPGPGGEGTGLGWSEATVSQIDAEIRRTVSDALARATDVVVANRTVLAAVADELVDAVTLEGDALSALLSRVVAPGAPRVGNELLAPVAALRTVGRPELAPVAS